MKQNQKTPRQDFPDQLGCPPGANPLQERDSLNNTIHDIELALERGKEQHPHDSVDDAGQMTGIELVLKRVAEDVSNKSDSGGILKQVKEFNVFLERAALALETRTR